VLCRAVSCALLWCVAGEEEGTICEYSLNRVSARTLFSATAQMDSQSLTVGYRFLSSVCFSLWSSLRYDT
jgi:hypothetical protein